MDDKEHFSHLYEIASHLNREFALPAALQKSLEKTVAIVKVTTGWIWLTQPDNKSVYLAASHNLPPALAKHPERLSGWCYCIDQYLSNAMDQAANISEIKCSRLKDIKSGTEGLKFHATIPITLNGEKIGLMNLLSKSSRQLTPKELTILNTISELIGTAIQRTQGFGAADPLQSVSVDPVKDVLKRVFQPQLEALIASLEDVNNNKTAILKALGEAKKLQEQLTLLQNEVGQPEGKSEKNKLHYPGLPISKRELEVLGLIKQGLTNAQIGERLFITERTVKFHVTAILSKLNAETRTQAVNIGLRRGFISL